jgi:hypothetical protein
MCYEYSSWFWKTRAKELDKARGQVDKTGRVTPEVPPKAAPDKPREEVKTPEHVPA